MAGQGPVETPRGPAPRLQAPTPAPATPVEEDFSRIEAQHRAPAEEFEMRAEEAMDVWRQRTRPGSWR